MSFLTFLEVNRECRILNPVSFYRTFLALLSKQVASHSKITLKELSAEVSCFMKHPAEFLPNGFSAAIYYNELGMITEAVESVEDWLGGKLTHNSQTVH